MNERFKELIEQCYETVQSSGGEGFLDFNKEKFAELIIKECIEIILGDGAISWADSIRVSKAISENFGGMI